MEQATLTDRLGLNVPYEWWPAVPLLKEIEAAEFSWVQVPSPPASVLETPRDAARHARALAESLGTSGLRRILHAPSSTRAGTNAGDTALRGLVSYAAEVGAEHVVYHAANFPDQPASEDAVLAETNSLARLAPHAERLGVTLALENLAPVFPGPDALCFKPLVLRTMVNRISSPAVGLCLDIGHANVVATLRHADPLELIEPVLDHVTVFHLHDNLGARSGLVDEASPEIDPLRLDLHLPPGRGTVLWQRLVPYLLRSDGPLMLEVHPPRPSAASLYRDTAKVLGLSTAPPVTA